MLTIESQLDWSHLTKAYLREYRDEKLKSIKKAARMGILKLRQKSGESLGDYAKKGLKLSHRVGDADDKLLVAGFIKGLRDANLRRSLMGNVEFEQLTMESVCKRVKMIADAERSDDEEEESDHETFHVHGSDDDEEKRKRRRKTEGKKNIPINDANDIHARLKALEEASQRNESMVVEYNRREPLDEPPRRNDVPFTADRRFNRDQRQMRGYPDPRGNYGQAHQWQRLGEEQDQRQLRGYPEPRGNYGQARQGQLSREEQEQRQDQDAGMRRRDSWGPPRRPLVHCYTCGLPGHIAPYCPDVIRNDYPRYQEDHPARPRAPQMALPAARVEPEVAEPPRIEEVRESAMADLVSSALDGVEICQEMIEYTGTMADTFVAQRRCREESSSALGPPRQKRKHTYRENEVGESSHQSPPSPTVESDPEELPEPAQEPEPEVIQEEEEVDIEMEEPALKPKPAPKKKQIRKPKVPTPARQVRMMVGSNRYDAVAEFKKLPVVGLTWGDLLDLAPAVRRSVGTGLLLEQIPRKKKATKPKAMEPVLDVTTVTQSNKAIEKPCRNFFTTAMIKVGNSTYKIEKTMIDAGSVVNLASQSLLEKIGVTLHPVRNVAIRTATSALTEIKYCAGITVFVGNIPATVVVYAIPREFNLPYGLLLSRGWLKAVKARGNYEIDSYHIRGPDGKFYESLAQ
jgi:hypothetical protein